MRRLVTALSGLLLGGFGLLVGAAGSVHAASDPPDPGSAAQAPVDIVEVSGLVDQVVADDLTKAIDRAASDGAQALIVQLNSKSAVISPAKMAEIAEAIHAPRCRWPSGSARAGRGRSARRGSSWAPPR